MRSRNGNHPFTLGLCALITAPALYAQSYHIGYRAVVKDAILISETLSVSRAMLPCHGSEAPAIALPSQDGDTLHDILSASHDDFYRYMQHYTLHVRSQDTTTLAIYHTQTTLTLPTHCFEVEFNDGFATIALIK